MKLQELLAERTERVIFRSIGGSHAYGTARENSDTDIRGIYVVAAREYLGLKPPAQQVSDDRNDVVYYSLRRFLELAADANPNIIELLFMPDDCVQYQTSIMRKLIEKRELFISKQCYQSHIGYAQAQIKRARGRNKWVNNPQPEEPPARESFCWVIPRKNGAELPYRPIALAESKIDLCRCHCSSLEHSPGVFRLYDYGDSACGVFRSGHLVCESIPLEDESKQCIGLLIYNDSAWKRALKDHRNYWQWRNNRNEQRWLSQERGEADYDAKNMMHTFRLLMSGRHILECGCPKVRFKGEELAFLMDILNGKFEYDELIEQVEQQVTEMEAIHASSPISNTVDQVEINNLLQSLTVEWEETHAQ